VEPPPQQLRCLIAAGGTAGHVLPALAVAQALNRRGVHVTFAGSPDRVEARLVPEAGYELDTFEISGLPRKQTPALARALVRAGRAPLACRTILRRRRPDVVLGGGGFVAGPMVLAAATMRIPAALTEADAHLGLANRLAAPYARRVFLALPIESRSGPKYRIVGRPIPERSRPVPQDLARDLLGLPHDRRVLVVFGALAGARTLNEFVVETFGERGPAILHITGVRDFELVRRRIRRYDYWALPETEQFGAALSSADLVLARSGGTVWEVAAAGKPAIFVPYPFATGDHQAKNAEHFVRAGGAIMVRELDLDDVPDLVRSLLDDDPRLRRMSAAMLAAARPNAAEEIAEELVALASA
jgi:UDP-N-acetylglucosamine--N-acetylmuramyl-(pentapeptide) pyrophosphoryl-undecaprenol N-acetylglucosamine transferase